ncbi:RNA polymerase sigma factor ShbA [Actinokineospora pegani]|uniref:RNA polymerase sigma factor ShbA n=1 Tax=Actinokineospora pegani TaxID=2654637 RepID=UPI0012EA11FB|nr:RNA polymerase sigma factor ShbA [Actinokineospora pegani]
MLATVELDAEIAALEASLAIAPVPPRRAATVTADNLDAAVAAAIRAESGAVEALLRFLRPVVLRYCRGRLGRLSRSITTAEDVVQEVCLAVYRALPTYQQLGRPFLSFVYGIAAHKIADVHRTNTRDKSDPTAESPDLPSDDALPEEVVLRHELETRTGGLLGVLTPRQRQILVMRVVMGMSAQETADAVGTTAEAIRVAQHRALNRLRKTAGAAGRVQGPRAMVRG